MRPRIVLILLAALSFAVSPADATNTLFFQETGQAIRGRFLEYWQAHGGLQQFGYPISPFMEDTGEAGSRYVQYFERARFELHPEKARPHDVLLGRLGVTNLAARGIDWHTFPQASATTGCRFFPETSHNLCEPFLPVWSQRGNLAVFGLPLSEAHQETSPTDGQTYLVQYFERNRFEHHPGQSEPFSVQLGLLGSDLYRQRPAGELGAADRVQQRVIELTQVTRAEAGLAPLVVAGALMRVAEEYSQVQAGRGAISHTGPDGTTPGQRLTRAGYAWAFVGENLGAGQSTADDMFQAWMGSPDHRAIILDPRPRAIGVGHTFRPDDPSRMQNYWTMTLAAPQ